MNFDSCWFSLVLNFDEYTTQFSLYAFFGSNREESILATNFDEYASQFSQYAFSASSREELIFKLRSGDTRLRERTTKTGLRPPLTVTSLVVFWTSMRELRKFRGGHSY
ncbi:hypothetical protein HZH68_006860 [Vespula germanica]|uniref:Uncharacterized protein n=1 Tax=Vespula germanica TaxID=30212 RepID=A0A834KE37_VESGE|nr:hypothetical protein HZH68_006860 [Vespula germanica]